MPYPSQINPEQIITTATAMIEVDGVEALSMTRLAETLGVKAPSLYRYFEGKNALLQAVCTLTWEIIHTEVMEVARAASSPRGRMETVAQAYRASALARPAAYGLAFTTLRDDLRVSDDVLRRIWTTLRPLAADYVGEADAQGFMTGLWSLMHGYIMLEICRSLHLDTDPDAAFTRIVGAYLDGWA